MLHKLRLRPARPGYEFASTVGAPTTEFRIGAGRTECALEGADASLHRVRRKVPITALAVWPQFQHLALPIRQTRHNDKLSGARLRRSHQSRFISIHRLSPTPDEDDAACPLQGKLAFRAQLRLVFPHSSLARRVIDQRFQHLRKRTAVCSYGLGGSPSDHGSRLLRKSFS